MGIKLRAFGLLLAFLALPVACVALVNYFGQYMAYFLFSLSLFFFLLYYFTNIKRKRRV